MKAEAMFTFIFLGWEAKRPGDDRRPWFKLRVDLYWVWGREMLPQHGSSFWSSLLFFLLAIEAGLWNSKESITVHG